MNQLSIESYKIFQLYPIQSSSHIKHPILTVCSCEILCLKDDRQAKLWFETALKITGAYRFISERNKYNSEWQFENLFMPVSGNKNFRKAIVSHN